MFTISNLQRNLSKFCRGSLLVKVCAICSFVGRRSYILLNFLLFLQWGVCPLLYNWVDHVALIKWDIDCYLIFTVQFDREFNINLHLFKKFFNHNSSQIPCATAVNLASALLLATPFCFSRLQSFPIHRYNTQLSISYLLSNQPS